MFGLIFGIIVILAGIIIGICAVVSDYKGAGIGALLGGIIVGTVCIVLGCMVSVGTGHTGIVTTFGRVEDYTLDSGFHFKAPWNDVIEMDNRVQKATVTLPCFSSDIQEVNTVYTVNYQISKTNAQKLYIDVGTGYIDTVINPAVYESVKTIMAHYTAEDLIGKRDTLASEIEKFLGEQLLNYNIEVVSTAIEDMDFTDEFTNAVEAKQVAVQNKLKAQTEQEQKTMEAQQAAERTKIEAEAAAAVAKIQAQADLEVQKINADAAEYTGQKEAAKNKAINESLTGELLKYFYIQQWDGKLPQTILGDDSSVILDLIQ